MPVSIRFTRFTPRPPEGFFLQWTLDGVTSQLNGDFLFSLERAGASAGPWTPVVSGLVNQYAYYDKLPQPPGTTYRDYRPANMFSFGRDFTYRLTVTAPDGSTAFTVDEASATPFMNGKMEGQRRKAARDFRVSLRLNGTEVALLKRKRWGPRCPKCVDKLLKEPTLSTCKVCYGTGFTGGFWSPIVEMVRREIPQGAIAVTPEGRGEGNAVRVKFPDSPGLDQGDLFVFFRDGRRYTIDSPSETQFQLNTVHQYATCLELPRGSILYSVPVDFNTKNPWV